MPTNNFVQEEAMKKVFALVLAVAGAAYYFLVLSVQVSERDVHAYFSTYYDKLDEGNHQAMCDLLAPEYEERGVVNIPGTNLAPIPSAANKEQACAGFRDITEMMKNATQKLGVPVVTNSSTIIEDIVIASNKKSALVTGKFELKIGTETRLLSKTNTNAQITLIKKRGKVMAIKSEFVNQQI
jgi:hypothetical protein